MPARCFWGRRTVRQVLWSGLRGVFRTVAWRVDEPVLPSLALGVFQNLPRGRLADIDSGAAAKVLGRDLRAHRWPPCDRRFPSAGPGIRAEDRREPAPVPSIAVPPVTAAAGSAGVGVAVTTSVSSSAVSFLGEADDSGAVLPGNRSARVSDSADNASILASGGPSVIAWHMAGSHIQSGTLRDTCGSPSTRRTIPSRRPASRA